MSELLLAHVDGILYLQHTLGQYPVRWKVRVLVWVLQFGESRVRRCKLIHPNAVVEIIYPERRDS